MTASPVQHQAEPLRPRGSRLASGAGLGGLDVAVARRGVGDESVEQFVRGAGHLVHGVVEGRLVCLGRPREAAQLPDELHRGGADLVIRGGWFEIMQGFDISAHLGPSLRLKTARLRAGADRGGDPKRCALRTPQSRCAAFRRRAAPFPPFHELFG